MAIDLVSNLLYLNERDALDTIEYRLSAGQDLDSILSDAQCAMEIVRERCAKGEYSLKELVHSGEVLKSITDMVKPERSEESAIKRLCKFLFCTVAGDINEIG